MENVEPSFLGHETNQTDHCESTVLASRENMVPHILKIQMTTNYNLQQCQEASGSNQGPFQMMMPFKENLTSVNSVSYQDESSGQIYQQKLQKQYK